jgi:hypothetical protein
MTIDMTAAAVARIARFIVALTLLKKRSTIARPARTRRCVNERTLSRNVPMENARGVPTLSG